MINLLVLGLLFQVKAKSMPPPVQPCTYEGKTSSLDKNGKVTTTKECFDAFIANSSILNYSGWTAIFSNSMRTVEVTDPQDQLDCKAFEIQDHQGFMYVCTTKK
jgi:hypothetical protein